MSGPAATSADDLTALATALQLDLPHGLPTGVVPPGAAGARCEAPLEARARPQRLGDAILTSCRGRRAEGRA